jgi:hypothetical protein
MFAPIFSCLQAGVTVRFLPVGGPSTPPDRDLLASTLWVEHLAQYVG